MDIEGWITTAAAVCTALLILMVAAPFMAPSGTFTCLDGTSGWIDNGWLGHGPAGLAYLLGDLLCHQEMSRSLILNGSQMPICIRDTGLLAGVAVGLIACRIIGPVLESRRFLVAGLCLAPATVIEFVAERIAGDMPEARLVSGALTGIGCAILLCWWVYRKR